MTNHRYHILYVFSFTENTTDLGDQRCYQYMKKRMRVHGTEKSLYAADFVFDRKIDFPIKPNGTSALYIEIPTKRNKDTWDQCFAEFLEWAGITITEQKVVKVNYAACTEEAPHTFLGDDVTEKHTFKNAVRFSLENKAGELGFVR